MGKILIVEGEDWSASPNAINISEIPVVPSGLIGAYSPRGATADDVDQVISVRPTFSIGPSFTRISGAAGAPSVFTGSSHFKGDVFRFDSEIAPSRTGGVQGHLSLDLDTGFSFTVYFWQALVGTGPNRVMLAFEPLALQFRTHATEAVGGHLSLGLAPNSNYYDVGLYDSTIGVKAMTAVMTRTSFRLYVNGVQIGSANLTAEGLPSTIEGRATVGANWNGASTLLSSQIKQFQFHDRQLTAQEITDMHAALAGMLA